MQPAQRPTLAQDGAFLNYRMLGQLGAGWRPVNPCIHAAQQIDPFGRFRQEITPCFAVKFSPAGISLRLPRSCLRGLLCRLLRLLECIAPLQHRHFAEVDGRFERIFRLEAERAEVVR
jgi:hypothetical protein